MRVLRAMTLLTAAACLASPVRAQSATSTKPILTLAGAKMVAAAAVAEAQRLNAPGGAIAVVDDGGNVLYLERLDNTFPAAGLISVGKAKTAALFRRPTKGMEDAIVAGRTTLLNVAETPLQGGEPVVIGGVVVGAVGVSGAASADQDYAIAKVAAGALVGQQAAAPSR